MLKAIFFDLDQTLIDFMSMKKASCEAAVGAMIAAGVKLDKEDAIKILYKLYDEHGIEYNLIFQEFLTKINKEIDYKILAYGITAYRKVQAGMLEPYPNVIPTLIKLKEKGLKLGIISDAPRLKAWLRLTEIKIADFFDVVISFEDTNELKPNMLPFQKAMEKLSVKPDECIMVGDNPDRDIMGAQRVGMMAVFAKYGGNQVIGNYAKPSMENPGAEYEITAIEDLLPIVDRHSEDLNIRMP